MTNTTSRPTGRRAKRVAVFGLGYVGSVSAACLAREGHDVVGVDVDVAKVTAIAEGRSPIIEPGLDEVARAAHDRGWLTATTSVEEALDRSDIAVICVGTPSLWNGGVDLSNVEAVCHEIGTWLRTSSRPLTVVLRSTVPPGTAEAVLIPTIEEAASAAEGSTFAIASCPEFLRESTAVADFYDPPFTVCGSRDDDAATTVRELFTFLARPFHHVGLATAEAVKYACNAFHATKITFANEIGRVTSSYGVDGREVMDIVCADERLNIAPTYLRPGFAFGGSCLPKDLRALLHLGRNAGHELPMLSGVLTSNHDHVAAAARQVLGSGARRVALLGLSFKPGTDDLRESPNVELAEMLLGKGVDVCIYDANVRLDRVSGTNQAFVNEHLPHLARLLTDDAHAAVADVDCAVVATGEAPVVDALRAHPPPFILDVCGRLPDDVEDHPGYWGAAWPGPAVAIDLRDAEPVLPFAVRTIAG